MLATRLPRAAQVAQEMICGQPAVKHRNSAQKARTSSAGRLEVLAYCTRFSLGVPEGIRTPGLLIRSQTLYPAELQVHPVWSLHIGLELAESLAERERFELSVPFEYAVLAGLWYKPLTHLSRGHFHLTRFSTEWRRVRDSNPRRSYPLYSFQDCRHKPLDQPSRCFPSRKCLSGRSRLKLPSSAE